MGITIHFEGTLNDDTSLMSFIRSVKAHAELRGWFTEDIESDEARLTRWQDEGGKSEYLGPTKGIVVYVAEDCEPVRFEFDSQLYMQDWVKTQFAGASAHVQVVGLLRAVEPHFRKLVVEDEGEFWETGRREVLDNHIEACNRTIEEIASEKAGSQIKVRTPTGRIVDLIT